jgi:hypothetical protein
LPRVLVLVTALLLTACSATVTPTPTAHPSPVPSIPILDVCHQDGITYCTMNLAVTQTTIDKTICVPGWTKTVRPPESYTERLKRQQLQEFASLHPGDANWTLRGTEEDHRLPLVLGGSPRDARNLSPEEPSSPNPKDKDEAAIADQVCAGHLTLAQGQAELVSKWLGGWPVYKQPTT